MPTNFITTTAPTIPTNLIQSSSGWKTMDINGWANVTITATNTGWKEEWSRAEPYHLNPKVIFKPKGHPLTDLFK